MTWTDLSHIADVVQVIGVPLALIGLGVGWLQLRRAARSAHAQNILSLDSLLHNHNEVRSKLQTATWIPADRMERNELRRYMAIFERMGVLLRWRELDLKTIDRLYGHRFEILVRNPSVQSIVRARQSEWEDLVHLWRELESSKKISRTYPSPNL
jgi:hypothetical protein